MRRAKLAELRMLANKQSQGLEKERAMYDLHELEKADHSMTNFEIAQVMDRLRDGFRRRYDFKWWRSLFRA